MKRLSVENFYSWSVFSEQRQIDFSRHLWVREEGNVVIDPVAISESDLAQLQELGGAALIVATNRDHARMSVFFREQTGAEVLAHEEDVASFSFAIDRRLVDGEEVVPGMEIVHLRYGKSPGEIALVWPDLRASSETATRSSATDESGYSNASPPATTSGSTEARRTVARVRLRPGATSRSRRDCSPVAGPARRAPSGRRARPPAHGHGGRAWRGCASRAS
jgi:hypothetical protein